MWLCSELVCTTNKFSLILNIYLEETKAKTMPAVDIAFCHFGQKSEFTHGVKFSVLRGFHVQVDFQSNHNTICNVFGDHWDQIERF